MFTAHLFCLVAVILISKDAQVQSTSSLSTGDSWKQDANHALKIIGGVRVMLKRVPGRPGRGSLLQAQAWIVDALSKEDQTDILLKLKKALRVDSIAFTKLNSGCIKSDHKPSEVITCKVAGALVKLSIRDLIEAILKVITDESKKKSIEALFVQNFQNRSKIPQNINATVIGVLEVMNS